MFGLIMFICLVPTLWIYFVQIYPKKWKEKKMIFGVKNHPEFTTGETAEKVEELVAKGRGQALAICIASTVLSALFLFLKGMTAQIAIWTGFVLVAVVLIIVPYAIGNREMKALKRSLGIGSEAGVALIDLSNAGIVHALNPVSVWIPNLLSLLMAIGALLIDLKVLPLGSGWFIGTFLLTAMAFTFAAMGFLMLVLAYVMDRLKNEVISEDSTINANYNRAKKKNMADMMVLFGWVNFLFIVLWMSAFLFFYTDLMLILSMVVYMVLLLGGIALFVVRSKAIEARYEKEITLLEDDDDLWILGMMYYNPKDKRLNVEKRVGVGGTVNFAHPVGKLVAALGALSIIVTIGAVIFLGMLENTPMQLRVENETIICHQFWDEYKIKADEIESLTYGVDLSDLRLSRVAGVGTPTMMKGDYLEWDAGKCKAFLTTQGEAYVKIVTKKRIYYVNAATKEETWAAFEEISKYVKVSNGN